MTAQIQRTFLRAVFGATLAATLASPALAQQSDRGRAIAEEADRRDLGWGDNASVMRMVLRNRNGDESVR